MAIRALSVPRTSPYYYGGGGGAPKLTVPKAAPAARAFNLTPQAPALQATRMPGFTAMPSSISKYLPASSAVTTTPSVDVRPSAARLSQPGNYTASLDEMMAYPTYQAALAKFTANSQGWRRDLSSLVNRLQTSGGYDIRGALQKDPTLAQYAGDISDAAIAAGTANPLSDKAQIEQAYNRGLSNLAYEQAAKGTLGSGAQATGATDLLEQSQIAHNQRMNTILDAIRGGVGTYAGNMATGQSDLQQALADAGTQLAQIKGAAYGIGTQTPETGPEYTEVPEAPGVTSTQPVQAAPPTTAGVQWGGQTFTSKAALSKYLASRGVSWGTWATNHPDAAARLR